MVCENRMKLRKPLIIFALGRPPRIALPNRRPPAGPRASKRPRICRSRIASAKGGRNSARCRSAVEGWFLRSFHPPFRSRTLAIVIEGLPCALLKCRDIFPALRDDSCPSREPRMPHRLVQLSAQGRSPPWLRTDWRPRRGTGACVGEAAGSVTAPGEDRAAGALLVAALLGREIADEARKTITAKRICGVSASSTRCARARVDRRARPSFLLDGGGRLRLGGAVVWGQHARGHAKD